MLLHCPHCAVECTIDNLSAETINCPGCGVLIQSHSTESCSAETRVAGPGSSSAQAVPASDSKPTVLDILPTPDQLPRQMGRYLLTQFLGEGGFGHVYRAFDSQLGREIALKIPRKDRFSANQPLSQFLAEARICAKLEHPGIVRIYDVGWLTPEVCFIAMELCSGGSMDLIVRRPGKMAPRRAAELVAEIAAAVHFAHLQALIHRDLKPSNILFGADGHPRIVDFGLALPEALQLDHSGEVAGTLPYMSPEQVRGESHLLDGRSDIWSLGAILYQLLSGRRPFLGNHRQIAEQILSRDPKPLRQISEEIPVELEQICLKCLRKATSDRWATAKDVAEELRHWLNTSRTDSAAVLTAPPLPAVPEPAARWRSRIGAAVIVTGVVGVVSLLAVALPGSIRVENGPAEKSKSPIVPVLPARADWTMAQAVPFRQYPLFARPSRKLAWPIPGESASVDHSLEEAKLNITSEQMTLIELGDAVASDFKLEVDIYKNARIGSSGLFWGYRADPENDREWHCYAIFYKTFLPRHGDVAINLIVVSDLTWMRLNNGEVGLVSQRDIASEAVPPLAAQGGHLSVRIGPMGLRDAQWNGQALNAIRKLWNEDQDQMRGIKPPHRPDGPLGVLNQLGSTLYRNANFTVLKGNVP